MASDFQYDVFLSHNAKDKQAVPVPHGVRPLAERLRADELKVPHDFGFRNSEFRFAQPGLSAQAFGSDWAQLACPVEASERRRKAGPCGRRTLRFRDPLNQERRFMSELQLSAFILQPFPDAPIKGSLAQFLYINSCASADQYASILNEGTQAARLCGVEERSQARTSCPHFKYRDRMTRMLL